MQNLGSKSAEHEFKEQCVKHGLKITPQRLAIFRELQAARNHPTCDDVFQNIKKEYPYISFDTVYRTLLTFSEIGMIRVVEGYGEKKRFDSNVEKHHHLRCLQCNIIIDFIEEGYDEIKVPARLKREFHVTNKRVVLEGICKKCRK